jgi:hypothetical protein
VSGQNNILVGLCWPLLAFVYEPRP